LHEDGDFVNIVNPVLISRTPVKIAVILGTPEMVSSICFFSNAPTPSPPL
jgi:hypothetical protein